MNARLKPLEFGWDNPSHAAVEERGPASRSKSSLPRVSGSAARVPAMQPGMTLDEWLTKIAEKKTKRPETGKPNRTATIKEFEAALARVQKGTGEEPAKAEEQVVGPAVPQATLRTPQAAAIEPVVAEATRQEPAEPDQVAKIANAMSMIADWMDHVDERSVDTSRLVLQQQERTTRVLVSAVTSVSKRLTEMAQQIKVLEDRIAALTPPAQAE